MRLTRRSRGSADEVTVALRLCGSASGAAPFGEQVEFGTGAARDSKVTIAQDHAQVLMRAETQPSHAGRTRRVGAASPIGGTRLGRIGEVGLGKCHCDLLQGLSS